MYTINTDIATKIKDQRVVPNKPINIIELIIIK